MSSVPNGPRPRATGDLCALNVVVVCGALSSDPVERLLDSGDRLMSYQITTVGPFGSTSVPVVWRNPPASAAKLGAGMQVLAAGHVHRRFFGGGGATQSRTEVVAERVLPARSTQAVRSVLARVDAVLAEAAGQAGAAP